MQEQISAESLLVKVYSEANNCVGANQVFDLPKRVMQLIAPFLESHYRLKFGKVNLPVQPIGMIFQPAELEKRLRSKIFLMEDRND